MLSKPGHLIYHPGYALHIIQYKTTPHSPIDPHTNSPWNVLGHHGVEAVEEVGTGHGEGEEGEEELWPATVGKVAEVAGFAIEGDDQLHV